MRVCKKLLHYLLCIGVLTIGIDLIFTTKNNLYACPRCRRALPKGPKKRPHQAFPNRHNKYNASPPPVPIISKNTEVNLSSSCSSCCCSQQSRKDSNE